MINVLLTVFVALSSSYLIVLGLRRVAQGNESLVDVPNERSSHVAPTPRGGGLAIVLVVSTGLVFWWLTQPSAISPASFLTILVGGAAIALVSWLDDLRSLPQWVRFSTHGLAALLVLFGVGGWPNLYLPVAGLVDIGWLGQLLSFFWIVGLTNVYNFMDGIDGLAGSQALVAGIGWAAISLLSSSPLFVFLHVLLVASTLGFLVHNWEPARIFMGDVGSAFLGYFFAVTAVAMGQSDPRIPVVGILLLWPFIFDASFTLMRRLLRRENIFIAHRSHLYQRLVILGFSHRFVTHLYALFAFLGVVLALVVFVWPETVTVVALAVLGVGLGYWRFVINQEER